MYKTQILVLLLGLLLTPSAPVFAEEAQPTSVAPDDSKMNMRDRDDSEPTADQGGNQKSDREIMQSIRKSVMDDDSLSTYGHNVKIISTNGKVTLKGPVRSADEKQNIEDKATEIAGTGNVTNKLSVKSFR